MCQSRGPRTPSRISPPEAWITSCQGEGHAAFLAQIQALVPALKNQAVFCLRVASYLGELGLLQFLTELR